MARGGYRPNSGPKKGTKYKKRAPIALPEPEEAVKKTTRKSKKESIPVKSSTDEQKEQALPLDYMLSVMNDPEAETERRDRMAVSAAPYIHARKGEGKGKKEEKDEKAKAAGAGRFAPSAPPKLAVVK